MEILPSVFKTRFRFCKKEEPFGMRTLQAFEQINAWKKELEK